MGGPSPSRHPLSTYHSLDSDSSESLNIEVTPSLDAQLLRDTFTASSDYTSGKIASTPT